MEDNSQDHLASDLDDESLSVDGEYPYVDDLKGLVASPRRVLPLEPEPSYDVARWLLPTERYEGEWVRHWTVPLKQIAIGVAAGALVRYAGSRRARNRRPGPAASQRLALTGAALAWSGWRVAAWRRDRFVLTDKRVLFVKSSLTRSVRSVALTEVRDVHVRQSLLGRMLNYGTLTLDRVGRIGRPHQIKRLPHLNELYLRIAELRYAPEATAARHVSYPDGD
jgi:Bacterial PH domain